MSYDMSDFIKRTAKLERIYSNIPGRAATIAVNFSKDRFRQQAWVDNRTEPWKKRAVQDKGFKTVRDKRFKSGRRVVSTNAGRAILVQSGRLKRSVRKIRVGPTVAVIGTDVPYASIHNYGGKIVTRKSRGNRVRSSDEKRAPNATMPRRQFLGESRVLATLIERDIALQFSTALKS